MSSGFMGINRVVACMGRFRERKQVREILMDEGDEHGMGLMGLENGCGDDGKWVWE